MNLTLNEKLVLVAIYESSESNQHDFGFTNDLFVKGLNAQQVNAVVGHLAQKGLFEYIEQDPKSFNKNDPYTITFPDLEKIETLIESFSQEIADYLEGN